MKMKRLTSTKVALEKLLRYCKYMSYDLTIRANGSVKITDQFGKEAYDSNVVSLIKGYRATALQTKAQLEKELASIEEQLALLN